MRTLAAQIVVLTGIPATFYYCFTAAVLAARQPHLDSQIAVATDSTTALAVLLAASHGLNPACAAMFAQRIALMPVLLVMLRRVTRISPVLAITAQLPILGAAAVMGWIVLLSTPLALSQFPLRFTPLILIVIGALIYIPLAFAVAPDIIKLMGKRVLGVINPDMEPV